MEQKDAYWGMQKKRLQEFSEQIEALQAAQEREGGPEHLRSQELESLRRKMEETLKKLDALKSASEHAWKDLRTGVEKAVSHLRDAVEQAVSEFERKER